MRINPNIRTGNINPYSKQLNKQQQLEKTSQTRTDKVEISSAAKELQKGGPIESARQERVESLKKQVQSGNYQVDPQAVAKKMVNYFSGQ
jgi:negative regulator of flagellin synthesis FlgM